MTETNETCRLELDHDWTLESIVEGTLIRDVLLCGNVSKNGREIPPSAFKSEAHVKKLYEGKHVFFNHLSPEKFRGTYEQQKLVATTRNVQELAGFITNVRFENGKPRADIQTAGAYLGEQLRDLVSARVPNVGLSHVAAYRTSRKGEKLLVESVEDVATVDVVISPATTSTFREQSDMDELVKAQTELATLKVENSQLQAKLTQTDSDLKIAREQITTLDGKLAAVSTEKLDLSQKVLAFEQKEAAITLRQTIEQQLKDAGLIVGTEQCSEIFVESLLATTDEAKRKAQIDDRLKLVTNHQKGSGERKEGAFKGTDVVSDYLNRSDLFAH